MREHIRYLAAVFFIFLISGCGGDGGTDNLAPTAKAGSDMTVRSGAVAQLDGGESSDPEEDPLTYYWYMVSQPAGSVCKLSNITSEKATFIPDLDGRYEIALIVNDGYGDSFEDTVTVVAKSDNIPPIADAGREQSVLVGTSVELDGSASSDADGDSLAYQWSMVSIPPGSTASLSEPSSVRPAFTPDQRGDYEIQLVVKDWSDQSNPATVRITASTQNAPPVAHAGEDQNVAAGTRVTLDGSESSDADGDELTFRWEVISTPPSSRTTLSHPDAVRTTFVADSEGDYVLELVVNDGQESSFPDTVTVSVTSVNRRPSADAGEDQRVPRGERVQLDGTGSRDPDGDDLTFAWSLLVSPEGSHAELQEPETSMPALTPDREGEYVIQLIVDDGTEASPPSTVTITAYLKGTPPTAEAGVDQNVAINQWVHLDGSSSADPDGDQLEYFWAWVVRPPESRTPLFNTSSAFPYFYADSAGVYVLELIVGDSTHYSTSDRVTITVTDQEDPDDSDHDDHEEEDEDEDDEDEDDEDEDQFESDDTRRGRG